ncbi:PREDICTED: sorbitol dehydrogenase-like [Dinoponera quadriceps]|uniref:Sorbitol dehydrogenase n=1 Tax=Dinoponera quadriceps TaxID=609295 RepID=A0A6P3XLM9_DINQU|nr:PREDICTED: sorbitol dehydrogenase-like [Dinoponera quadriceps]
MLYITVVPCIYSSEFFLKQECGAASVYHNIGKRGSRLGDAVGRTQPHSDLNFRSRGVMAKDNLTAVLYGINDLRLENTPIEEPQDGEVLLEMACVGICGSDVHYLVNGRICDFVVREPMIIGHESAGIVAKLGKNVKNLKVGDRVAIEPGVCCRVCKFCKTGRYNLCKDMMFCATPPVHGSLRRFYKHAADFCFKLPDHVSLEEGALLEPLSVGVHACKRGSVGIDCKVLILGAGPIGLVTLLVAKAMGASKVVITDILESRLKIAKKLGADDTYLVQKNRSESDTMADIHAIFGDEPDRTIDASGAQSSIRLAILVTKSGGVVVLVGMGAREVQVPLINALVREVDIRGVFRYVNDYSDALDLIASGKIDVKPLITHNYKMEDTMKAFETSRTGADGAIKVMIHCK